MERPPESARRSGAVAPARAAGLRTTLAVGLLVLGAGDLVAIDTVLLPRYLASRSHAAGPALATVQAAAAPAVPLVAAPLDTAAPVDMGSEEAQVVEKPEPAVAAVQAREAQPTPRPPEGAEAEPPESWPRLLFERNTARLSPESREALNRLAAHLRQHTTLSVVLDGHTDDLGADDINRWIARARAVRAQKWLVAQGLDPSRIEVRTFSSSQPAAAGRTAEARAQNRRVEITVRERIH